MVLEKFKTQLSAEHYFGKNGLDFDLSTDLPKEQKLKERFTKMI